MAMLLLFALAPAEGLVPVAQAVTQGEIDQLKSDAKELASETSSLKSQLADLKNQRSSALKRKQLLDQQISLTVKAIENTEKQISGFETLLAQTEYELDENRKQEERQYAVFCERARVMEEAGTTSYWAVLFKAENFSDLLSRLSDVQEVMDYDQSVLDGLRQLRAQIESKQEEQEELMAQTAIPYRSENTVSIDFVEDWEIRECDLPVENFTNLADVALQLNSTKSGEVTYTVESGDCWSVIAQDHNLTSDELLALNPGYDIDRLSIGDELLISNAVPYLTVISVQMEYYEAEIPYEIEYVDDNTMWEGDTRVISKGAYGKADTVARVTYQGVEEMERTIESQTMTLEPVTEVQARGTLERPSWAPTGTFRWPTSGNITSKYGYRNIFGGSSFHSGIDIANSYGTDIVAADGGEVVYAGWMSGYGYLVQIDHQNGYITYYGHNSSLLVSVGDKVFKGQHIAEMGSTGRSTGNHCHFEVRYNGERQNPMNYLP